MSEKLPMSREEACRLLGVKEDANKFEIENRYTLLAKSYRGKTDPESEKAIAEFTRAYDILTGRYVEPPEIDPKEEERIFGRKRKDWKNFFYYAKTPILIGAIVIGLVVWLIYSVVTNTQPDFRVSVYGDFIYSMSQESDDPHTLNGLIWKQNPQFAEPLTDFYLLSDRQGVDPQTVMASQMKFAIAMSGAEKIDLFVFDKAQYERIVKEGALVELDAFYEELVAELSEEAKALITPLYYTVEQEYLLEGEVSAEHIYGIDLSAKQALNGLGVRGPEQIICLGFHSEQKDTAKEVLRKLLVSITDWYDPEAPEVAWPTETSLWPEETEPEPVETSAP